MNKRIERLLLQVAPRAGEDGEYLPSLHTPEDIEKFAQLIVEECIKLNGKELAMAGHSRMVDVYCEHFGIEE